MEERKETILQFSRFLLTGVMNVIIDFSFLNLLIFLFGIGEGNLNYLLFRAIAASIAIINSFFWNKFWVFKKYSKYLKKELLFFILVTCFSLFLNITVSSLFFFMGESIFLISSKLLLANLGACAGLFLSSVWNFLGYKYIAFKK